MSDLIDIHGLALVLAWSDSGNIGVVLLSS